ncbi:hypothetical protein SUDANB121_04852 [Nocardiopsis dassonvillei]|uniref:CAP domain-containing protein n=1 Tax=Nocardiopsis dassonvillei TaxID=2014 RepID=UPI003F54FF07
MAVRPLAVLPALVLALSPAALPAPADGAENAAPPPYSAAADPAAALAALVGEERTALGGGGLRGDERLTAAAVEHARDMADRGYFSHATPEGESAAARTRRHGHTAFGGENLAAGHGTPERVVRAWMDSEGHRRDMLAGDLASIGVGYAVDGRGRPLWVAVFGRPEEAP